MWPTKSGNPISPFPKNILSSCKKLIVSCQKTAKLQNHSSCNMIAILYSNFDRAAIFCLNFQDFERLIWFCNRSLGKVIKLSRKKTLGHPLFSSVLCWKRGTMRKSKMLMGSFGEIWKLYKDPLTHRGQVEESNFRSLYQPQPTLGANENWAELKSKPGQDIKTILANIHCSSNQVYLHDWEAYFRHPELSKR